jgi:PAS domain S-box-containing protein
VKSIFADPRVQAVAYAITAALLMFCTRAILDICLATDVIDIDGYRVAMVARTIALIAVSALLMKRHLELRARAERRVERIADAVPGLCALVDRDGHISYANSAFLRKLSPAYPARMNLPLETVLAPHLMPMHGGALLPIQGENALDIVLKGRDGVVRTSGIQIRRLDDTDKELGWIVTGADDAESQEMRADHTLKTQALDTATDGIAIADLRLPDLPLIYVNRAFRDITGYTADEVLGRNLRFLQGNDRMQPEIGVMRERIAKRQPVTVTLRNYRRDGTMFWNEIRLSPVCEANGSPSHYICVLRDVTELKQNARDLAQLAYFDPTTRLYNRTRFAVALSGLLTRMDGVMLLMTIDVMRFNDIVSCFGETAGDVLLAGIAERLRALPDLALAGRLGDNAFGIAIELADETDASRIVDKARATLREPFRLQDGEVELLFYVGMAIGRRGMTSTTLLHQALVALNQSRQTDAGATRSFDATAGEEIRRRVGLSRDLQQAIGRGDFKLHLQPSVALDDRLWVGAEALARWRHPVFGLQSPALFLSISEQTGQILEIDAWALRGAAAMAAQLNQDTSSGQDGRLTADPPLQAPRPPLVISVNISSLRLRHHDLVPMLRDILAETGADPATLKLEIAERALASGSSEIVGNLARLRALGFGIVIDDFGVGASCLAHLNKLPVTEIKIDRSFIRGCETSTYHQMVIESFVSIGRTLSIEVTATGVENEAQKRVLERLGIRQAQGFLFSAPIDASEFAALAAGQSRPPLPAPRLGAVLPSLQAPLEG